MKQHFLFIPGLLLSLAVQAQVKPANIFTDNMLLQRNHEIRVWGTASAGEKITVEFNGQTVKS